MISAVLKPSFRRNIFCKTKFSNLYPIIFNSLLANKNTFLQPVIMIYLKYHRLNVYQNLPFVDKPSFRKRNVPSAV